MRHVVVVVESPAKAKTIHKYLGKDFTVIASLGHVRDLPTKEGSVDPDANFRMIWESDARGKKQIKAIEKVLKEAHMLYLATDPDREGEAIAWHVLEMLKTSKVLANKPIKRIVFYEVTKSAVQKALTQARDLDQKLIDAYLTRRALDYLVGFTLSPVLWRKLPGSRSAGRVQSVALRLITDREEEIDLFKSEEYWSIKSTFLNDNKTPLTARLTHYQGTKLDKLSVKNEKQATTIVQHLKNQTYSVLDIDQKKIKRHPLPPFTTSTLQQEASHKLYFSAKKTMRTAQQLYEGIPLAGETTGLITYMRTDAVFIAQEALTQCRSTIESLFGDRYVPETPHFYKTKAKNAQEAHEAIRPTSFKRTPEQTKPYLDTDQLKLYTLIWNRATASQMALALLDQVSVDIGSQKQQDVFRATGTTISFDGFLKVYRTDDQETLLLPALSAGQETKMQNVEKQQHFTQPPPRYTEASLVKKLEELGIGRPSTYATILNTLQERGYAILEKRRFTPQARGRILVTFLKNYFEQYVAYDFTARLEEGLDHIASGETKRLNVLNAFWPPFKVKTTEVKEFKNSDIIDVLNEKLGPFVFGTASDARQCPQCTDGTLSIKNGRHNAFIGCSAYPECGYTRQFHEDAKETPSQLPRDIGVDPQTNTPIVLKKGPYGLYLEWKTNEKQPKRVSVPRHMTADQVNLDLALNLSLLPRLLGAHPKTGADIVAGLGPYGPYLKHNNTFTSLKAPHDVLKITLDEAVQITAAKISKKVKMTQKVPRAKKKQHVLKRRQRTPLKKT